MLPTAEPKPGEIFTSRNLLKTRFLSAKAGPHQGVAPPRAARIHVHIYLYMQVQSTHYPLSYGTLTLAYLDIHW